MYIIGKTSITEDKNNRINIKPFIRSKPMEKVVLVVDTEEQNIKVLDASKYGFGTKQNVEAKGRITIPNWIIEELGDYKEFFLIIGNNDEFILSPKTGSIL